LEAHEFGAIEVARALERDQHLLYFVEGDGLVVGKTREMMRKLIAFGGGVDDMVLCGELADIDGGRIWAAWWHALFLPFTIAFPALKIHEVRRPRAPFGGIAS
jgi:hypothetical protein